jgi:hypothetical protein
MKDIPENTYSNNNNYCYCLTMEVRLYMVRIKMSTIPITMSEVDCDITAVRFSIRKNLYFDLLYGIKKLT